MRHDGVWPVSFCDERLRRVQGAPYSRMQQVQGPWRATTPSQVCHVQPAIPRSMGTFGASYRVPSHASLQWGTTFGTNGKGNYIEKSIVWHHKFWELKNCGFLVIFKIYEKLSISTQKLEDISFFHIFSNNPCFQRADFLQMRAAASGSTPTSQISDAPPTTTAPPLGTSAESTPSFLEQPPVAYSTSANGTPQI